jgi:hypothetical protein
MYTMISKAQVSGLWKHKADEHITIMSMMHPEHQLQQFMKDRMNHLANLENVRLKCVVQDGHTDMIGVSLTT